MDDQVHELERLAEADHRLALSYGAEVQVARLAPDLQVRVHRALGNAHRALSQLSPAFDEYAAGIDVASRFDLAEAEGLIRMSRAGAHSIVGSRAEALADLDRAEHLTTDGVRARVLFQRAAVVQRFSEGIEARQAYDEVIPELRRHGDDVFLAHALSNRGVIHIYQGNQGEASADLQAALEIYERLDMPSPAAVVVHNLGVAHTRMLDIPQALHYFDEAETRLTELGRPLAGLQVDRAETLVAAGLADDALEMIDATVAYLRKRRLRTDLAEALLVSAHASLILGRDDAADRAGEAAELFDSQDRPGWRDRAHILRLEALLASSTATAADLEVASRLSTGLSAAGLLGPAGRAALSQGSIALALGRPREAADALRRGGYSRRSGLIEERLAYWALAAAVRLDDGDRSAAMTAARTGLGDLEAFRERVAAPDARAGAAIHAERLIDVGLRAAEASASSRTFFEWIERTAAPYVDLDPPAVTGEVGPLLGELRQVVRDMTESPEAEAPLARRRAQLEGAIKRRSRRAAGSTGGRLDRRELDQVIRAAAGRHVLAYVEIGGRIHRCHLSPDGGFQRAVVGDGVELARRARAVMALFRRVASRPDERALARLARTADELDRSLLDGLPPMSGDLIVVPRGALALVPWMALPRLAEARVTVSFSLSAWARSMAVAERVGSALTIVVGPGLPVAVDEAKQIADTIDGVEVIQAGDATAAAALEALRTSDRVHFACHGEFRSDNPLFSHLELVDGPLTVYDILELDGPVASEVVLSACSGAEMSVRPERAFIGMSGAFLAAGIRSLVASVSPVPDSSGIAELMTAFHRHRATGEPASAALRAGQRELNEPRDRWLAASFVTIGAG